VTSSPERRPGGTAPFWEPGETIWWRYRRRTWVPGDPETVHPMRVVRDDHRALIAWLPGGTPILAPTLPNGANVREAPLSEIFTTPRVQGRMLWKGRGTLRMAPTGMPWSVWFFWAEDGAFDGWYVNLETPHVRDEHSTYSSDHVLDVVVEPGRTCRLKDEDELEAAVHQGRYTAKEADAIRDEAVRAVAAVARGDFPFGPDHAHWWPWRPDPGWPQPQLPEGLRMPPAPPPASAARVVRAEDSRY